MPSHYEQSTVLVERLHVGLFSAKWSSWLRPKDEYSFSDVLWTRRNKQTLDKLGLGWSGLLKLMCTFQCGGSVLPCQRAGPGGLQGRASIWAWLRPPRAPAHRGHLCEVASVAVVPFISELVQGPSLLRNQLFRSHLKVRHLLDGHSSFSYFGLCSVLIFIRPSVPLKAC